jgi:hypothetical protein
MLDRFPEKAVSWLKILGGLLATVFLIGLLWPVISVVTDHGPKPTDKAAIAGLVTALKVYHTEYGHWPDYTGDGRFLDATRNAQLLRTLCNKDEVNNPRHITFFESRIASRRPDGSYRSGFHPESGVLFDKWGQPYCIVIDADEDGKVIGPYVDQPPLPANVIAWSLGKDGLPGSQAHPNIYKDSDDVVSWQP